MASATLAHFGEAAGYGASSISSVSIGTGTKTFATQANLAYRANMRVRVANDSTHYVEGVVTSYGSGSLVVDVDRVVGSGTFSAWTIGIAGDVGPTGADGEDTTPSGTGLMSVADGVMQTPGALTGDVTTDALAATIANNAVTLAKMATMATASLLGRNTAGTGNPEVLSASTAKSLLSLNNVENTALSTWAGTTNITTIGAATATSLNGLTVTGSTGTLTITNGKTLSASNTLTLAGTDGSTLNVGTGGTLGTAAYLASGTSAGNVPVLDGSGKIAVALLPAAVLGAVNYQGTWNATTNSPTIPAAASGNKGYYYKVATAGTTDLDGITDWQVGDWAVSNGAAWEKIDNTDLVSSVNGQTGAVSITTVTGNAGTATALATARAIYGNNFDGTAALTQIIASTYGGTGNGFAKFSGPTTSEKTFTLPDASATILTTNNLVTVAQGGTGLGTLTNHGIVIGAGTSTPTFLVGASSGDVPTWNGTTWVAATPEGGGDPTDLKTMVVINDNYTAAVGDIIYAMVGTEARVITLPEAPADGSKVAVFDFLGQFTAAKIVVLTPSGDDTVSDASSLSLTATGYYVVTYDAAEENWVVASVLGTANSANLPTAALSANTTPLTANFRYLTDTSGGAISCGLPTTADGDIIEIIDITGDFATNACTITPDTGATIEGGSSFVCSLAYGVYRFVYDAAETNWTVEAESNGGGGAKRVVALVDLAGITANSDLMDIGTLTLGSSNSLTITGTPSDGQTLQFRFLQDSTGGRTVTWPSDVIWGSDIPEPTLSTDPDLLDVIGLTWDANFGAWLGVAVARGYAAPA